MKKRLFSILLVLCMALTMLPVTALAEVVSHRTDYDIAINGTKWKFDTNDSGEYIPVYYYANYTFNTDAGYGFRTDDNLKLTKVGNTVTISFRRGTGNKFYSNPVEFTIESGENNKSTPCIEMGNGNNLVITGEGSNGTLYLTHDTPNGSGAALSSEVGDITITGGATVNVTFKKQETPNVSGHAISVDNHDLIISGEGTTVEATNQSSASRDSSNDATVMVEGGSLVVSDGAWLKATNEFTNNSNLYPSQFYNLSFFSSAISGDDNAPCTVSVTGEKSRITASAHNSTGSMGQAYRWADFKVDSAKIEVGNSSYPLTESTVDSIKGYRYVTISVPTAPAPHTHTFDDTWTTDATDHWHACTASDCNNDIDAIKDKAAHTDGTATCTAKKVCTVCNQPYGELDPSKHTALSDWTSDATGHWKVCTDCNATDIVKASHTYGDWIIDKEPNATEAGSRHKVCTICNYETHETIPAIGHTHTFDNAWHDMGNGCHAHKCTCGAFGAAEDHTYQNGKCTACGAADPTDPAPVEPTPGGSVIIITPEATGPVFLSGANQTVALGSAAAFRIDYNYAAFRSVAVDGVTLTPADYTTWEGSTWVKLTPAYVKTLGIGTHTLSVYFDGATATTTFTVGSQPNPATGARDAVGIAAAAAVIALLGSAALLCKK